MEVLSAPAEVITIPTYIDQTWIDIHNEKYGNKAGQMDFTATLEAEDWLVQQEPDPGSSSFKLEDKAREGTWTQMITGKIWDFGITHTTQYENTSTAPIIALVEAKVVLQGREDPITSPFGDPLVLVRLDRLMGKLAISPIEAAQ